MVWVEARILEHEAVHKKSSNGPAGRDHLGFLEWSLRRVWAAGAARGHKIQTSRNEGGDGEMQKKDVRSEINHEEMNVCVNAAALQSAQARSMRLELS